MTLSWVALHSKAYSFIELDKAVVHVIRLVSFLSLWLSVIVVSVGLLKKQESSRKTSISALLTMPKPLTVWITKTVENSDRDGNTRPPDLPPEKSVCRQEETLRTGHGATHWFQIGKEVHQGCILSP